MKKIIVLCIVLCLTFTVSQVKADDVEPSAYGITVSDGWDFTKRSIHSEFDVAVNGNSNFVIGLVSTDAFLFKLNSNYNSSSTYDYYLVNYRISVLPKVSKKKYNWFFNYYGWSECMYVSTNYLTNEKITNYAPKTENPSASYNVGLSIGASDKLASASLTAGVCYTENSLKITARHDSSEKKLTIKYDYLCDILHSKDYLTDESFQYGMFVVQVKKGVKYSPNLTVNMTFAKADGWSSFLQTYNGSGSRYSNYITYNF